MLQFLLATIRRRHHPGQERALFGHGFFQRELGRGHLVLEVVGFLFEDGGFFAFGGLELVVVSNLLL